MFQHLALRHRQHDGVTGRRVDEPRHAIGVDEVILVHTDESERLESAELGLRAVESAQGHSHDKGRQCQAAEQSEGKSGSAASHRDRSILKNDLSRTFRLAIDPDRVALRNVRTQSRLRTQHARDPLPDREGRFGRPTVPGETTGGGRVSTDRGGSAGPDRHPADRARVAGRGGSGVFCLATAL